MVPFQVAMRRLAASRQLTPRETLVKSCHQGSNGACKSWPRRCGKAFVLIMGGNPQPLPTASTLQTTTLDSGVRVATESTPGHFAAIGLYVDCGTRYESHRTRGSSHMLDKLAFKVCALF